MLRRLLVSGSASLILCATAHAQATGQAPQAAADAAAQTTVQLIDAGTGPREALRYTFRNGSSQKAAIDLSMQMALDLGGQHVPLGSIAPLRMTMDMKVAEVGSDGAARLEFALVSAEVIDATAPGAGQLQQELARIEKVSGSYRMDTRGQISESKVDLPQDASAVAAGELVGNMEQTMQQLAAPFPLEPVGTGARWQVVQQANTGVANISQTAEYTLRSRTGSHLELDVKIIDSSIDVADALPPGARVLGMRLEGGGSTSIDLTTLVPTADIDVSTQIAMSISAQGQSQNMMMDLQMQQAMRPVE